MKSLQIIQNKLNQKIQALRSQSYQKRVVIMQVCLMIIICFLFLGWIFSVKNNVAKTPVSQISQESVKEKTEKPDRLTIFQTGIDLVYQDYLHPFFSKAAQILSGAFSHFIGLVIKIVQPISYGMNQLITQYKAYVELIFSLIK